MTLRRKTLLVIGATIIALLVLLYAISNSTLRASFAALEQSTMQNNLSRVLNTIDDDLTSMSVTGQDWAQWDSTYAYAQGEDPAYAQENLYDEVFLSYRMNVILFLDRDLRVLFGRGYDLATGERTPVPYSIWSHLTPDDALIAGLMSNDADSSSITRGIVLLDEGPLMFVALPILRSDGSGPPAGVMLWGRLLDSVAVGRLADLVRLPIAVYGMNDPGLPTSARTARNELGGTDMVTHPLSSDTVVGYTLLYDIYGAPAAIAELQMPRSVYQHGELAIQYFGVSLLIVGVVFLITLLIVMERVVLRRLMRLSRAVSQISTSGNPNHQVPALGSDELGALGSDELGALGMQINNMLDALQVTQKALKDTNQTLERRVRERTSELSQSNQQLRLEIEERERIENELREARDQALASARLKAQILANVSHDSRTPLNAILGYAEMLQEQVYGPLNPQQYEAIQRMVGNAQSLLNFINNLLDSSKIEANNIQPHYGVCQLGRIITSIEESVGLRAREKKLLLEFTLDPTLPTYVYTDEQRFKQIVTNLTVNAIKFTDQGSVWVRLYRIDEVHMGIEVKDTGRGIPREMQTRIFEAFWQVDGTPTRRNNSGVGLGLAIVQALVRLLDGEISVVSDVGQGSTFTVTLPLMVQQTEGIA